VVTFDQTRGAYIRAGPERAFGLFRIRDVVDPFRGSVCARKEIARPLCDAGERVVPRPLLPEALDQ
jgi:hypothetical protein